MGKRKRICIKVGELGALIKQREESKKKMFGEVITDIMSESQCSWEEAKKVYRKQKAIRGIAREFKKI